jgi:hypothetical protein
MSETTSNKKFFADDSRTGVVFSKRAPGRRRQPNIFLTKRQMRLLSGILSSVKNHLEWQEDVEAWEYKINGDWSFLGDLEKSDIGIVLKRLYRCIDVVR